MRKRYGSFAVSEPAYALEFVHKTYYDASDATRTQNSEPVVSNGNATFTVDGFWYEESTERDKGENRPCYASMVNEPGGEVYFRDFLGVFEYVI